MLKKYHPVATSTINRIQLTRLFVLIGLLGVAASASATIPLTLQLRWQHQFQFAGYYAALEQGFFDDEGLDVTIAEGGPGINPIDQVLAGHAQLGVGSGELVYERLRGEPLVALAAIFQHSASVLMVLADSGIVSPQDLVGKRVSLRQNGQAIIEVAAMLSNEGVAPEQVIARENRGGIRDLFDGNTDAEYGYITNEPWLARRAGIGIRLLRPLNYGVDFYGDTLFTSEQELAAQPDAIAAFRRAALRGWDYAMHHQEALIALIKQRYAPNKTIEQLRFEATAMRSLIHPELIELGHMNPGRWQTMADTFVRLGMAPADGSLDGFVYHIDDGSLPAWVRWALYAAVAVAIVAALVTLLLTVFNRRLSSAVTDRTRELAGEVERRRDAEQALLRYNETLEQRVTERTAELRRQTEQTEASNRGLKNTLNELQRAQQELVQSEKMAALGQLVAGIAHEINTPLGAIQLSNDGIRRYLRQDLPKLPAFLAGLAPGLRDALLALIQAAGRPLTLSSREHRQQRRALSRELQPLALDDNDDIADTLVDMGVTGLTPELLTLLQSSQQHELLRSAAELSRLQRNAATIDTAAQRAAKVVFALKTYAHRDAVSEKHPADINQGIDTVLTLYHNQMKHGVELRRHCAKLPEIPCYPDELNQVWTNLIHNALQAMENRGTLEITTSSDANQVIITISDSGPGVPTELHDKVFQPFYTTKGSGEGSGLGLDIVRRVIERHQGSITLDSASPHGAVFTVRLPLVDGDQRQAGSSQ